MEQNKKMTAVEYLMNKLYDPSYDIKLQIKYFEEAKQMEKEQMLQFGSKVTDRWGLTKVEEHYIEDEYNKYYLP
jgi:hypothetical protein